MPGIVRTRVGYAGGTKANPTYHALGDHTETIQMDFDPKKTSYREIMRKFWRSHNACGGTSARQYRSAVFYHDEEQKKIAEETRTEFETDHAKAHTDLEPLKRFYWAEDYHQKYTLRNNHSLCAEMLRYYPKLEDFVNSTAAARLNSYLSGYGAREELMKEIDKFGISEEAKKTLLGRVRR